MDQVWKPIKNFSRYEISNIGNVRVILTGLQLKQQIRSRDCNYYHVLLVSDDGKRIHKNTHRLVAEAFIANPLNKPCVNHIDGNKHNNNINNLEWVTRSENDIHAFKNGLRKSTSEQIQKAIDSTRRPVRNKTNGIVYRSITDAAKAINGKLSGVYKCVVGERKRYKGMEFEFIGKVGMTDGE